MTLSKMREDVKKAEQDAIKSKIPPVPIRTVASLQNCIRPVLEPSLYTELQACMAAYEDRDTWRKWGFDSENNVALFTGEPGTGKTTAARWMAKQLRRPLVEVSMGAVGGQEPGQTERALKNVFDVAKQNKAVIYFDECEAVLWDRSHVGPDSMWMLGVINAILVGIENYEFLVILSSNFEKLLDTALLDRVSYPIHFPNPSYEIRKKLWYSKWPQWPLACKQNKIVELSQIPLNGRGIKTVLEKTARFAILQKAKPTYTELFRISSEHFEKIAGERAKREREASKP